MRRLRPHRPSESVGPLQQHRRWRATGPLALHVARRAIRKLGPEVLRGVEDGRRALQAHHAGDGHLVQPELTRFAEQIGVEFYID
jgi:hypothetical protein